MKPKLRITLNAPFTLIFSLLCCIATILCVISDDLRRLLFSTHAAPLTDPLMYVRLFTHVLGHSGFPHLIGNLTLILLLGPALEKKYGIPSLLLVVLATALITGFIAKESVVSTLQILLGGAALSSLFTVRSCLSFLVFTLLYTPCVVAVSAVRRELGSGLRALGVVIAQTAVAWIVAFAVYQLLGLWL